MKTQSRLRAKAFRACSLLAVRAAVTLVSVILAGQVAALAAAADVLKVGSKRFTESYILGDLMVQAAAPYGPAEHKAGLGNTGVIYSALKTGAIDVYPEYSGTIVREILKLEGDPSITEINRVLSPAGLAVSVPLGFNNSYALGVREELANRLSLTSISDLVDHPELRLGLSQEFLARKDGWPGLAKAYGLLRLAPVGLDHGLAYEALAAGKIDLMDTYATDAKIGRYGIRLLVDDRRYFPRYDTLLLHRADTPQRFPRQWQALLALQGRIDARSMMRMNAAVEIDGRSFAQAATLYFAQSVAAVDPAKHRGFLEILFAADLARLTREHLLLVFGSLAAAIVVAVPLGIAAARLPRFAQPVFALVGVVQTIPSLALLAFLIALMGSIGPLPAATALFLYALLPIVRNTHTGLLAVGDGMRQAAQALGMSQRDQLFTIELPLARTAILAGIKTSAVINVGTATIAAFVGAGGYGERIAAGLAVNDNLMMLAGAVPAAVLALLIQALFDLIEHWADPVPKQCR